MNRILFPRAFAFAVDDLGWNEGSSLAENTPPGPYRAGVKRSFDLKDYAHVAEVGKKVGARIQCLFILSEMDRENILAKFPTTTYQREKWNNSIRVNDEQKVIMNYVRDQAAHMEFGLHGTGHEYWAPGQPQKRAEWYNLIDKEPWPEKSLREHLQCFVDIMAQYGFSKSNGHSFPESFVPCAYSYYWNPTGNYSLGKLLSEVGVKYANTDFSQIPELNPPSAINGGGFDFGTHVVNRLNYGNLWYELATLPRVAFEKQETDFIESHWPNWLAQDDFLQPEITSQWVAYYRNIQRSLDRYIAKNTEQLHSQWLYNHFAMIREETVGKVTIDNTKMPYEAYRNKTLGSLVLKVRLDQGEHLSSSTLDGKIVPGYFEDQGFGFLYLPMLERRHYTLQYAIGKEKMPIHVFHDGTYNVYDLALLNDGVEIDIKVYGTEVLRFYGKEPVSVNAEKSNLKIQNYSYDPSTRETKISIRAADMQGSRGRIIIQ